MTREEPEEGRKEELTEEQKAEIERFYRAEYGRLFRAARSVLGGLGVHSIGRAEDAVQESFCVVLRKPEAFFAHPAPAKWLRQVLIYTCNHLAREEYQWQRNLSLVGRQMEREEAEPLSTAVELEDLLEPEEFRLLWRIYIEGCAQKEIGRELGLKASATSMKITRIKEKFLKRYRKFLRI